MNHFYTGCVSLFDKREKGMNITDIRRPMIGLLSYQKEFVSEVLRARNAVSHQRYSLAKI